MNKYDPSSQLLNGFIMLNRGGSIGLVLKCCVTYFPYSPALYLLFFRNILSSARHGCEDDDRRSRNGVSHVVMAAAENMACAQTGRRENETKPRPVQVTVMNTRKQGNSKGKTRRGDQDKAERQREEASEEWPAGETRREAVCN